MKALIRNGSVEAIVDSLDGYDLAEYTVVDAPENPTDWIWDGEWQPRPPTLSEQDETDLDTDARWQAVLTATPQQIDAWLTGNVTDLASARRVLKFLIVAVRRLHLRG